jgi:hypothetical protein
MKFFLVFDTSGDIIPYEVVYNHELFEFFVDQSNQQQQNSFSNQCTLYKELDKKITHLHWALSKTNEVLYSLIGQSFEQHTNLENYLDQDFLNKTHCDWVFSQNKLVDIDQMRFNNNSRLARIGNRLHDLFPDEIRSVLVATALEKLGYIYPYEEVNLGVHGLETTFNKQNLEFSADGKWKVFSNPFMDSMISNNSIVNFSFGYTYVGRQYYNKFEHFDTDLCYKDHYNYETLEFSFQLNLQRPQTIAFSPESIEWARQHSIPLTTTQLPIANITDLDKNLFEYRKILYRNSRDNNRAKIVLN